MKHFNRRHFIAAGAAGGAATLLGLQHLPKKRGPIPGAIVGGSAVHGHRLWEKGFATQSRTEELDVVVAGGGIAGLAAARQLRRLGCERMALLELESQTGGNAIAGKNLVSAYPWGAHYVPLPNRECKEIISLFEDLGVITGWEGESPIYNENMLCGDPSERLFIHGQWQEGLIPQIGVSNEERRQYERFLGEMEKLRFSKGKDDRFAFALPLDESSRDAEWLALDAISMATWMDQREFTALPLRWYVDYCCRDDFGAGIKHISAWAGIHYFASRRGVAANAGRESVLTWPDGNGWIAQRLSESLGKNVRAESLVYRIEQIENRVEVDYVDLSTNQSVRIIAKTVVCAMPYFVAQRIVRGVARVPDLEYSPWMVANITLNSLPQGKGAFLAWDNVICESASLGYIVATHQDLNPFPLKTVLTHYWPLDQMTPREARKTALKTSHQEWCEIALADLELVHPGIRDAVERIDIWVWGHGMIRPQPNLIWGEPRKKMLPSIGQIFFAHSDLSGMSLFEEAYIRGVHSADSLWQTIS